MAVTTTLSSVGVSNPVNIDWMGSKPVTCVATLGSTTMTADFTIQFTLDDLQTTTTQTWFNVGSSAGSAATHFSSANADASVILSFLNPVAALRISSTAISSSSLSLRVLQGPGG